MTTTCKLLPIWIVHIHVTGVAAAITNSSYNLVKNFFFAWLKRVHLFTITGCPTTSEVELNSSLATIYNNYYNFSG